jgi:hypothetical protein
VENHSETPFPKDYLGLSRVVTHFCRIIWNYLEWEPIVRLQFQRIIWDYLEWKPISVGLSGFI